MNILINYIFFFKTASKINDEMVFFSFTADISLTLMYISRRMILDIFCYLYGYCRQAAGKDENSLDDIELYLLNINKLKHKIDFYSKKYFSRTLKCVFC